MIILPVLTSLKKDWVQTWWIIEVVFNSHFVASDPVLLWYLKQIFLTDFNQHDYCLQDTAVSWWLPRSSVSRIDQNLCSSGIRRCLRILDDCRAIIWWQWLRIIWLRSLRIIWWKSLRIIWWQSSMTSLAASCLSFADCVFSYWRQRHLGHFPMDTTSSVIIRIKNQGKTLRTTLCLWCDPHKDD